MLKKVKNNLIRFILISSCFLICGYVPPGQSPIYYKIGGGDTYPLPPTSNVHLVPLRLGVIGKLNYNCGKLDPKRTMQNSLNNLRESVHSIQGDLMNNLQAAIGNLPMLMLQRADPGLYDLINKYVLGAMDQLKISSKACAEMEALTAQGKNPYEDWLTIATRSGWKKNISLGDNQLDANKIKQKVNQEQGKDGVEWAGGEKKGGENQLPILVIEDTAIAGYNALLGRRETDRSRYSSNHNESHQLVKYWETPASCATWIVKAVGDNKITLKANASDQDTESTPGVGLLPELEAISLQILQQLSALVRNHELPSAENLAKVSAPGMEVTIEIIQALQSKDSRMRTLLVRKISQDVAMSIVIEKSYLAKRILHAGANIPNIKKIPPAQIEINRALKQIDGEINDLINMARVKKETISHTLTEILLDKSQDEAQAASVSGKHTDNGASTLNNGAIKK